jgi:acyl-CoA thioesterase I
MVDGVDDRLRETARPDEIDDRGMRMARAMRTPPKNSRMQQPTNRQPSILTAPIARRRSDLASRLPGTSRAARTTTSSRRFFLQFAVALFAPLPAAGLAATGSEARSAEAADRLILVLGDSLSAEYGIGRGEGWVKLLEQRTAPKGWGIVNASISGETTAGGLARLPALLAKHRPAITIIELGANDALRGLQMSSTQSNLQRMVRLAREAGSQPLLVGMMMPPNFGPAYARQFSEMYRRVADDEKVALVPFLLEGFADDLSWFQPDRIHPTAKAQPRMLDNVWPVLSGML